MFNSIHQNLALFVPKHSQNSEICEISGPKITYLKKQTQFFPLFSPKTKICRNPKPIQTQLNPIQTQFLALFNYKNSVSSVAIHKSVLPVLSVVEGIRVTCLEQPVVSKVEPCEVKNEKVSNFFYNVVNIFFRIP